MIIPSKRLNSFFIYINETLTGTLGQSGSESNGNE